MNKLTEEFKDLFKTSGWTQAEAARHLEMTRGGLNGILNGRSNPSPSTLKLLRILVRQQDEEFASDSSNQSQEDQVKEGPTLSGWEDHLLSELRRIPEAHARRFAAHTAALAAELADALASRTAAALIDERRKELDDRLKKDGR